jgi:CheY-like chemotaxis protein
VKKILVVDDSESFRFVLVDYLKGTVCKETGNCEILEASDGREGLAIFRKENPQLVITDLGLPRIRGEEVIRAIKKDKPETKIIAMSGKHDLQSVAKAAGCDEFFGKPFDLPQFKKAVEKLLKNWTFYTGR